MSEKNQKHDSGANVIKAERQINLGEAVLVFIMSIVVIGYPALSKQFPIAMGILLALVLCCTYAMLALKISWDSLFDSITKTIAEVLFGLLFCLFVGFISASWIASGTIPFLFYWGLKLFLLHLFLRDSPGHCCHPSAWLSWESGQLWECLRRWLLRLLSAAVL